MTQIESLNITVGSSPDGEDVGIRGTRYVFDRSSGPRVLLTGALHGNEPTATGALWYLAERLNSMALTGVVTIIPCVNKLAVRASSRLIPHEESDLNRCFPGRSDGSLAERLAATLVGLLEEHDALIDVHTAGWCVPFVLIDHISDAKLCARVIQWASASALPLVREMPVDQAVLQGLGASWSAWAVSVSKLAFTMELSGFHTLDSECAMLAADSLVGLLRSAVDLKTLSCSHSQLPFRLELYVKSGGLFEALRKPGDTILAGETIGWVRSLDGVIQETVCGNTNGLILAVQPISAMHVGSWVATLAVSSLP